VAPHVTTSGSACSCEGVPLVGGGFASTLDSPVCGRRDRKAVPSKSKQLIDRFSDLDEAAEHVRTVLQRYNKASARVATLVDQGVHLVPALESLEGPVRRSEVTEALEEFEAARHRVRLAMFALAKEQGSSFSDVARALGISRQLASRLAGEAEETQH